MATLVGIGATVYHLRNAAWPNIDQYTYNSPSFIIGGGAGNHGLDINQSDGSSFYYPRGSVAGLIECPLPTPWDITSNVVRNTNLDITAVSADMLRVQPNDGSSFIMGQDTGVAVVLRQYPAVTPWSLTGVTEIGVVTKVITGDLSTPNISGLCLKPDATSLWLTDGTDNTYEYTMTGGDLNNLTLAATHTSMPAANDLYFSPDGLQYYTTLGTNVRQWNLTAPFDLTTIPGSHSYILDVSGQVDAGAAYGITFRPSGSDMYLLSWSNREIHRYSI